jgi:hypothetical protein
MNITHTITTSTGETVPAIARSEWRQSIERIEANRRIHRSGAENNPECMMCGRKMSRKAAENARHIHMTVDLDLVPMTAEIGDLSQGWHAVGSECAKLVPQGFASKAGA